MCTRLVLFRKYSFLVLLQHLILLSLVQDGAICAEALEKSKTIVLRLLRSGKLSSFRGNKKKKKYLKCLSRVVRLCSSSFCSLHFQSQYSKCPEKRVSDVDIMRWRPRLISGGPTLSWKMFYILFSLLPLSAKSNSCARTLGQPVTLRSLSAWAESTQFVYSRVILMWSALFFS